MQTVVLVIALWLILVGLYGAVQLLRGSMEPGSVTTRPRQQRRVKVRREGGVVEEQAAPRAILSEVDLLRAQVRHLRSEIFALSGTPPEPERPTKTTTSKRYRPSPNELPRPLRRHLRETRGVRSA